MPDAFWLILLPLLALGLLVGLGALHRALFDNPRGDFETGVAFFAARVYSRLVHRLRVRGAARVPQEREPGPLIVVANHTAGVDPILIQVSCPFYIRWVMAEDMRAPALEWFWGWWRIIFVDREKHEAAGFRAALRHLKQGGVIGIFPEGGIERPPRRILAFQPGVGALIKRTGARVLPVLVDGTPQVDPAWASLWRPSASVIHFQEPIDYAGTEMTPAEIAEDLRRRFLAFSGWPASSRTIDEIAAEVYQRRDAKRARLANAG